MSKISVYVIAYNEADKVRQTLQSALWADELLLIDSHSTDGTAQIAEELGARVVQVDFDGFGALRNAALDACTHDWVFSLDSDERCTPEVRDEILAIMADPASLDVYRVPRRNFFMGRWIKHSGWYPNYRQPQLFRRGAMRYQAQRVHEGYQLLTGKPVGHLSHAIWQIPYKNHEELLNKMNRYSTLGVNRLAGPPSMWRAFSHASWAFIKHFFFKLGMLDGWAGFVIALGYFEVTFYRYAKYCETRSGWKWPTQPPVRRH